MAGRGPAPGANPNRKDSNKRVRRNAEPEPSRVVTIAVAAQPELPAGEWHPQTIEWWDMWGRSPLTAGYTEVDWAELLSTAVVHSAMWSGDLKMAAELRQRVAKFGATPEDRARLRIQFASADEADERRGTRQAGESSRERYTGLKLAE